MRETWVSIAPKEVIIESLKFDQITFLLFPILLMKALGPEVSCIQKLNYYSFASFRLDENFLLKFFIILLNNAQHLLLKYKFYQSKFNKSGVFP